MSNVSIRKAEDRQWRIAAEAAPDVDRNKFSEGELASQVCIHQMGDESNLQLFGVRFPPDAFVRPHAHEQDEIIYIVAGEMRFGTEVLHAGSSVKIAGGALYSFSAGPEGLEILNFRPRMDVQYWTPADLRERRQAGA